MSHSQSEPLTSKQCAECVRYENGREVLMLLIDTQKDKIKQLEAKLIAAEQLAVRQGNEIRKLRAGERA